MANSVSIDGFSSSITTKRQYSDDEYRLAVISEMIEIETLLNLDQSRDDGGMLNQSSLDTLRSHFKDLEKKLVEHYLNK